MRYVIPPIIRNHIYWVDSNDVLKFCNIRGEEHISEVSKRQYYSYTLKDLIKLDDTLEKVERELYTLNENYKQHIKNMLKELVNGS